MTAQGHSSPDTAAGGGGLHGEIPSAPENSRNSGSAVRPWVVTIAASAGGIQAIRAVLASLPRDFPGSIVIVQHRSPSPEGLLKTVLQGRSSLPVMDAVDGEALRPGIVYLARPDMHLTIAGNKTFQHTDGRRIRHLRSSANPLFESAAEAFDGHLIAVVLSGGGSDATDGVQGVKTHGGLVIAQDQATSQHWHMPKSAIDSGAVDYVLPVAAIGPRLDDIVRGRFIPSAR